MSTCTKHFEIIFDLRCKFGIDVIEEHFNNFVKNYEFDVRNVVIKNDEGYLSITGEQDFNDYQLEKAVKFVGCIAAMVAMDKGSSCISKVVAFYRNPGERKCDAFRLTECNFRWSPR